MKGKSTFTMAEAQQIRQLIRKKLVASPAEQKLIRDQIRALGFYIIDFSSMKRYTVGDFDRYITITID